MEQLFNAMGIKGRRKNVYSQNDYLSIVQNWHTRFLFKIREGSRLALDDPF